jgi:hypothetical protein
VDSFPVFDVLAYLLSVVFLFARMTLLPIRPVTRFLLFGLLVACKSAVAVAQPLPFGSSDDPAEHTRMVWRGSQNTLDVLGGFSLIGPRWWTTANVSADFLTRTMGTRIRSSFRVGIDTTLAGNPIGPNRPDFDEPYDILRQLEFFRFRVYNPANFYLRLGPIARGRLGTGHLVNFFSSSVAWDERTVGGEFMVRTHVVDVAAFADNVLFDGIVGGRVALRPLTWSSDERARTLELGLNAVADLSRDENGEPLVTGFSGDLSFAAAIIGEAMFAPYVSFAWYEGFGSGLAGGGEFKSDYFLDVARFTVRLGAFHNSDQFVAGHVGSFYTIQNARSRILDTENVDVVSPEFTVGIPLADVESGNGLEFEFRAVFFERFEFWWQFKRHFGSQALSESHLRLMFQTSRLRAIFHQDRAGLRGLLTVFNDLGDQTALNFETEYLVAGTFWVVVRARYSYERVADAPDGTNLYLVQRRFEPLAGLRIRF